MLNGKTILITGGTGSFGKRCTRTILERFTPKKVIIFSRDELKQYEMAQEFPKDKYPAIRFFIGDVRDKERLYRAFNGVDYVIHAAAMKHVPASEYNPTEAIKTNVYGAQNIINVAADRGVSKVVALSTDKAVSPANLYGATKLCSDKLFVAANAFTGTSECRFAVVRYGNVLGSRGSVVPFFMKVRETGELPVTDERMTRFWITLDQGVDFVLRSMETMKGGEIFVPKLPSMNVMDLARAIGPDCSVKEVGIRPGEKLHEAMIPSEDARHTVDLGDRYVILPDPTLCKHPLREEDVEYLRDDFEYNSGDNDWWLSVEEMRTLLVEQGFQI